MPKYSSLYTLTYPDGGVVVERGHLLTADLNSFRSEHPNHLSLFDPGNEHVEAQSAIIVFDFDEPLRSNWNNVLSICRTDGSITELEAADAGMARETGLSTLQDRLFLAMLVSVATTAENWPLLIDLAARGSPEPPPPASVPLDARQSLNQELANARYGYPQDRIDVLCALLRHGWRDPFVFPHAVWRLVDGGHGVSNHSTSRYDYPQPDETDAQKAAAEAQATQLFDVLVDIGYLPGFPHQFVRPGELLAWLSNGIRAGASVPLLRHVGARVPFAAAQGPSPGRGPAELLCIAANGGGEYRRSRRGPEATRALLAFLIDEQGLSVDGTALTGTTNYGWVARTDNRLYRQTALHAAVEGENLPALSYLLERGAKIKEDEAGRTPFARAVYNDSYEVVGFFADYFQERGVGFAYIDE